MSAPPAILRPFAGLAPVGRRITYDVMAEGEPFLWLGTKDGPLVVQLDESAGATGRRREPPDTPALKRLAALDALYPNERLVREGWVWLCGRAEVGGQARQLC